MTAAKRTKRRPRVARPPRPVLPADRKLMVRELNLRCRPGARGAVSIAALRMRAIVLLTACAGLRISEVCKLNAFQFLDTDGPRWKLRSLAYLRPEQSKGRRVGPEQWDSAGTIMLADEARTALRAYIAEARRREWMSWPPKRNEPLFVGVRGNGNSGAGRHRLSPRTLQWQFAEMQKRAGIDHLYHFHCLRHDAMTRCAEKTNGNLVLLADYGRCDVMTAMQYVHLSPQQMLSLRNELRFAG